MKWTKHVMGFHETNCWNGMECKGLDKTGMEWNGMQWIGQNWNGML